MMKVYETPDDEPVPPECRTTVARIQSVSQLSIDDAAEHLGVSRSTLKRWRGQAQKSLSA